MNLLPAFAALIGVFPWGLEAEPAPRPLWPGSRYTDEDRDRAVERGLEFLHGIAADPEAFARWGSDLIWCFYSISETSANARQRGLARGMGYERAI